MRILILSGRDEIYKSEAYAAALPGLDGEFSVMDFHQPFLYRLQNGRVKVKERPEDKGEKIFPVKDGIARFSGNSLLVLCE